MFWLKPYKLRCERMKINQQIFSKKKKKNDIVLILKLYIPNSSSKESAHWRKAAPNTILISTDSRIPFFLFSRFPRKKRPKPYIFAEKLQLYFRVSPQGQQKINSSIPHNLMQHLHFCVLLYHPGTRTFVKSVLQDGKGFLECCNLTTA